MVLVLKIWWVLHPTSLPLLPGPLWLCMLVPVRVLTMVQLIWLKIIQIWFDVIQKTKSLYQRCKYECISMRFYYLLAWNNSRWFEMPLKSISQAFFKQNFVQNENKKVQFNSLKKKDRMNFVSFNLICWKIFFVRGKKKEESDWIVSEPFWSYFYP